MDNIQNWIYLILGAIYFLSKLRKKSKPATSDTKNKESTRSKKIKTFEELLGELTGFNQLDESKGEDVKVLKEDKNPNVALPSMESEKVSFPNSVSKNERVAMETEEVSLQNTPASNQKDFNENIIEKNIQIKVRKNIANEIRNELKTTKGMKRAAILSELFKRKY